MIKGGLFTRDFLLEGVTLEPAWSAQPTVEVAAKWGTAAELLSRLSTQRTPNEAETELGLIFPLLDLLGWEGLVLPQQNQTASGRQDVPDALLFAEEERLARARGDTPWKRFQFGACVVESKRWNRPLDRAADRRDRVRVGDEAAPSSQLLRYLRRADDLTNGALRWGMLTNGRLWRLYWSGAVSVAEDFLEIDLGKVFGLPGVQGELDDDRELDPDHVFRLFLLVFGREAFLPSEQGRTFHALALEQGRRWEERVAHDLSQVVFAEAFPRLASALGSADTERPAAPDGSWLEQVRQAALILLYRLLFVLYAEDRDLLPDERGPYANYCLSRIRREIEEGRREGRDPDTEASVLWSRLQVIFRAIQIGNDRLGVPPYNGGLFDPVTAPLLSRVSLNDAVLEEVIFRLSFVESGRGPRYVNYRDLSVQQLGSIYERILEFGLRLDGDGDVEVDADGDERHDSGSFYTPEALVQLIIARAVGPLVQDRLDRFADAAATLAGDRRATSERLGELAALDPASAILELKVCDPAMGSGHFLVSLVDWLTDRVLAAMADAPAAVTFGSYASPLSERIATVRARITAEAEKHGWPLVAEHLDDKQVVRRMVLKRVVYGVDKNPMAVELAKVALWLHSFTVGAPLSFLDHHLRCGDSVLGAWVHSVRDEVSAAGALLSAGEVTRIENVAASMSRIEETTDNDVAEVAASKAEFGVVEEATEKLESYFSLLTARPLLGVDLRAKRPPETPEVLRAALANEAVVLDPSFRAEVTSDWVGGDAAPAAKTKVGRVRKVTPAMVARAEAAQVAYDRATALKATLEAATGRLSVSPPARLSSPRRRRTLSKASSWAVLVRPCATNGLPPGSSTTPDVSPGMRASCTGSSPSPTCGPTSLRPRPPAASTPSSGILPTSVRRSCRP